jgi:DNA-binding response OmpR family regulator
MGPVAVTVSTIDAKPTVLIVDDERDVADLYALRLQDTYAPVTAYGGVEAVEKMDEHVAAVLLDRRMPDMHGDEVLERIRAEGYDCPVIMVTAVDPDLNILEMDFDDYLCKPVDTSTLTTTLDQHVTTRNRNEDLERFLGIMGKLLVLEAEHTEAELVEDTEYRALKSQADELAAELRDEVDDLEEIVRTHESIARGG